MMHLAITEDGNEDPRLFRNGDDAQTWLEGETRSGDGLVLELEKIDLEPGFRLIHRYSNIPGELDNIR